MIDELWGFGSFAQGALKPSNVDIDIEYTADEEFLNWQVARIVDGGNFMAPLVRAVRQGRRGIDWLLQ